MQRRHVVKEDLIRMRLPERHWRAKLSKVQEGGKGRPREMLTRYFKKIEKVHSEGVGLLLWGPNGTGKTAAAAVVGKVFRSYNLTVLFLEAASLSQIVINNVQFDSEVSMWDRALSVDLLILDDLGKGGQDSTGFGLRKLDELLRWRASRYKITMVTTNMNLQTLAAEVKPSTMHILKECLYPVLVDGVDHREEVKRSIARDIMEG